MRIGLELGNHGSLRCHPHCDCNCTEAGSAIVLEFTTSYQTIRLFVDKDRIAQLIESLLPFRPPEKPFTGLDMSELPNSVADQLGNDPYPPVDDKSTMSACEGCGADFKWFWGTRCLCEKCLPKPENAAVAVAEATDREVDGAGPSTPELQSLCGGTGGERTRGTLCKTCKDHELCHGGPTSEDD